MSADWYKQADCLHLPNEVFFDHKHYDLARTVCQGCPVQAECLAAAIKEEGGTDDVELHEFQTRSFFGFRGGKTPKERRAMVADFLRTARKAKPPSKWKRRQAPAECHPNRMAFRCKQCQPCYKASLAERKANANT